MLDIPHTTQKLQNFLCIRKLVSHQR
jgi:hypothetical protein